MAKMTFKEFLLTCKEDTDVYDNYDERVGICWCPLGIKEFAFNSFSSIMDLECEIDTENMCCVVNTSENFNDEVAETLTDLLWMFMSYSAGYCEEEIYNKLFYPLEDFESKKEISLENDIDTVFIRIFTSVYASEISEKIKKKVIEDVKVSSDYEHGHWNDDDIALAIGRAIKELI